MAPDSGDATVGSHRPRTGWNSPASSQQESFPSRTSADFGIQSESALADLQPAGQDVCEAAGHAGRRAVANTGEIGVTAEVLEGA